MREMLMRFPEYSPRKHGSRLHKLLGSKGDDELRDAGLKLNFSFAPDGYDHGLDKIKLGTSASNPVLYRHIVARAESMSPSPADEVSANLADWVVKNIVLPPPAKAELERYEEFLRNRSP